MLLRANSLLQTKEIASTIALKLHTTPCLLLRGGLGAGKTTFSKFLIHELTKIPVEEILSPTYSYMHLYSEKIAHFDLYRIVSFDSLEELGLEEVLTDPAFIKIIEWPDVALSLLPRNRIEITIDTLDNEERSFTIQEVMSA
ncbi:MAG: tRNA (adenosine(37)-N6)-threonylcarbamoyltransferase complex ATPase subunit type 1 TsaE [Chlamydiia bacterium]